RERSLADDRRANHQHVEARAGERGRELIGAAARLIGDIVTEPAQQLEAALGELVGDPDPHRPIGTISRTAAASGVPGITIAHWTSPVRARLVGNSVRSG